MAKAESHDKVCPNCGHCPTCGRSNPRPFTWPYGYPWYPPYRPYGTGYPITVWNQQSSIQSGQQFYNINASSN